MESFSSFRELLKKEREKQNISLQTLSSKLKIPVFILEKLENDDEYIKSNYPYSIFLMNSIAKELNLPIFTSKEIKHELKETKQKIEEKNFSSKNSLSLKEKIQSLVKIFSFPLIFLVFTIYPLDNEKNYISVDYNIPSNNIKSQNEDKLTKNFVNSPLLLIAKNDIWITADVDGEKKVIYLKKGERKKINFEKIVKFETIGNADNLTIIYNGKKVSFFDKVIHNVFVDIEGIFKDGYNLLEGRNS